MRVNKDKKTRHTWWKQRPLTDSYFGASVLHVSVTVRDKSWALTAGLHREVLLLQSVELTTLQFTVQPRPTWHDSHLQSSFVNSNTTDLSSLWSTVGLELLPWQTKDYYIFFSLPLTLSSRATRSSSMYSSIIWRSHYSVNCHHSVLHHLSVHPWEIPIWHCRAPTLQVKTHKSHSNISVLLGWSN